MKPGSNLFGNKIVENVSFPFQLNEGIIEKVLTKKEENSNGALNMYI